MNTLTTISMITLTAAVALAAAPTNYVGNGKVGWYDSVGYGACGKQVDATKEEFAAVPAQYWTIPNPNNDPLCKRGVLISYKGKSVTLPIKDKCVDCPANKVDISKAAFAKLADLGVGTLNAVSWSLVDM